MAKARVKDRHGRRDNPKDRSGSQREEQPRGEVVADKGASGAPQGGRIDGRHGEQEGIRY
jgi:hypothetical protein